MKKLMSVLLSMAIAAGTATVPASAYAEAAYSPQSAGNAAVPSDGRQSENIEFTYYKDPGVLTEGESYTLQAQVTSYAHNISYAAGVIYDADGNTMYEAKDHPGTKFFDFAKSNINDELRFDLLPAGSYILRLSAKDTSGNLALRKREFTVAPGASEKESDIKFTSYSAPANFTEGESCTINAEVESSAYEITYAAGAIYEAASYTMLYDKKTHPNSYYFSFADSEINELPFDELQAGSYVLRLSAQDSSGETVIKKLNFTVYEGRKDSDIRFVNCTAPDELTEGDSFAIKARVESENYRITDASGAIFSSDGWTVYESYENPNSYSFDFSGSRISRALAFEDLSAGKYTLRLTATDANGTEAVKELDFIVKEAKKDSDIKFTSVTAPNELTEGDSFTLKATVQSQNYKITDTTGEIIDSNGRTVYEKTEYPNSYSFDYAGSLISRALAFEDLSAGEYTLKLIATDANGTEAVKELDFTVKEAKKDSDIKFTGVTAPNELTEGDSFALKATVQSQNYKITDTTGEIIDSNGRTVYEKTEYPNSYSFNYAGSSISRAMAFEDLSAGEYTLKLTATDENGGEAVKEFDFTVNEPEQEPEPEKESDIKFYVIAAPEELTEGDSFMLKAVVQSRYCKLTNAAAEIVDSDGSTVFMKNESPNSNLYYYTDSPIGRALPFEDLSAGEYSLRLIANDENGGEAVKEFDFTVNEPKKDSDVEFVSFTAPENLTEGDSFAVKAKAESTNYKIVYASGTITDYVGIILYEKVETPSAYSFNFADSAISSELRFDKLSEGDYTLRLMVGDSNGTVALKTAEFTVTEKSAKESDISFFNCYFPELLKKGQSYSIQAETQSRNYELTRVSGAIVSSDGETLYEESDNPESYSFDFSDFELSFDELPEGDYVLRLSAEDSNGGTAFRTFEFTVEEERKKESDIKFVSYSNPKQLKKGQSYSIKAEVESSNYKIIYASGSIIDSNGTTLYEKTEHPNANTFRFTGSSIASALKFEKLPAGTYTLRLSAKDKNDIVALKKLSFTVTEESKKQSDIQFVNASTIPSFTKGSSYTINAKVTSDAYKITYAAGALINSNGKTFRTRNTNPNSNSFDFGSSTINEELDFKGLGVGKYKLRLSAKDSNGTTVIKFLDFMVKEQSKVTFTSYTAPPKKITQGQKFDVDATVTSSSSKITVVSGKIIAADGSEAYSKRINPNSKSFSFKGSDIDNALKFDKLAPGKYTLRLAAKTADSKKTFVKKSSFTVTAVNADFTGEWYWPLPSNERKYNNDSFNSWRPATNNRHQGIDISVGIGTSVYAASPGIVYKVGWNHSSMGNYICIKHGKLNGKYIYTTYMHLSQINLTVGQNVDQNSLIGKSGNSGNVPAHLHFHIVKSDSPNSGVSPRHRTKTEVTDNYIDPSKIEYKYIHRAV